MRAYEISDNNQSAGASVVTNSHFIMLTVFESVIIVPNVNMLFLLCICKVVWWRHLGAEHLLVIAGPHWDNLASGVAKSHFSKLDLLELQTVHHQTNDLAIVGYLGFSFPVLSSPVRAVQSSGSLTLR